MRPVLVLVQQLSGKYLQAEETCIRAGLCSQGVMQLQDLTHTQRVMQTASGVRGQIPAGQTADHIQGKRLSTAGERSTACSLHCVDLSGHR